MIFATPSGPYRQRAQTLLQLLRAGRDLDELDRRPGESREAHDRRCYVAEEAVFGPMMRSKRTPSPDIGER